MDARFSKSIRAWTGQFGEVEARTRSRVDNMGGANAALDPAIAGGRRRSPGKVDMSTLPILDRSVQKTNIWLRDVNNELGWFTFQRGYLALRAVLHALRDRLTTPEIAQLGAQLPIFVRGIYYEGWNPARTPVKSRGKALFLRQVRAEFAHTRNPDVDAEHVTRAIFRVLSKHVSKGEVDQVKGLLPKDVREFWPDRETSEKRKAA